MSLCKGERRSKGLQTTYPSGYLPAPAGTGAGACSLHSSPPPPSTPGGCWWGGGCLGLRPASRTPLVATGRPGSWGSIWAGLSLTPLESGALRGWKSGPQGALSQVQALGWGLGWNAEGSKPGPWLVPSPLQPQAVLRLWAQGAGGGAAGTAISHCPLTPGNQPGSHPERRGWRAWLHDHP